MNSERSSFLIFGPLAFSKRAKWFVTIVAWIAALNFAYFQYLCKRDGGDALNGHVTNGRYYLSNHHGGAEVSREVWEHNRLIGVAVFCLSGLVPLSILALWLAGEIKIDRSKGTRETVPATPTSVSGPLCFSGTIVIPGVPQDLDPIILAVEAALLAEKPKSLARDGDAINFRSGILGSGNRSSKLMAFGAGEVRFSIEQKHIAMRYRVSLLEMFLLATGMVVVLTVVVPIGTGHLGSIPLILAPIAWCWLFGMNAIYGVLSLRQLLRNAAATASCTTLG